MDYPFFVKLINKNSLLPIEICEHILSFSDIVVQIIQTRDNAPIGWFYYGNCFKPLLEIREESELAVCMICDNWKRNCTCGKRNSK